MKIMNLYLVFHLGYFYSTGVEILGIGKFIAKIGLDNEASIKLFQQLGFEETSRSQVFCEATFSTGGNKFVQYLRDHVTQYTITN